MWRVGWEAIWMSRTLGVGGKGETGYQGDAGADQGTHEAVVAGAAGDLGPETAEGGEHVGDVAGATPALDPAVAGELGQADGRPVRERVARRD